jgi:hypothetical protein
MLLTHNGTTSPAAESDDINVAAVSAAREYDDTESFQLFRHMSVELERDDMESQRNELWIPVRLSGACSFRYWRLRNGGNSVQHRHDNNFRAQLLRSAGCVGWSVFRHLPERCLGRNRHRHTSRDT